MYHRYIAEPKYGAQQKFYALLDEQFPMLTTYYPAAQGKPTAFEIPSIWNALVYVGDVAHGRFSGPTIKVYKIPADRR
jgi:hypothetical protein